MKAKFTTLMIICIFFSLPLATILGQVTMGSNLKPEEGALLDLKEKIPAVAGGETASRGLALPRVELLSTKLDATTYTNLSKTIKDASGSWNEDVHIGLVVYNVSETTDVCKPLPDKGIYVWNGSEWQFLGEQKDGPFKDVRTVTDNGSQITISYNGETTSYNYSSFGAAGIWMTENLATKYLPDGTALTRHTANSNTQPQYFTPNNMPDSSPLINTTDKQGLLYNWPGAMAGVICSIRNQHQVAGTIPGTNEVETVGPLGTAPHKYVKGICPTGWHLPSVREFNELEKVITENSSTYSTGTYNPPFTIWDPSWETIDGMTGTVQAAIMKSPNKVISSASDTNGTSKSSTDGGFDVLLVGVGSEGQGSHYGVLAKVWTSSAFVENFSYAREFKNVYSQIGHGFMANLHPASVRCKKN